MQVSDLTGQPNVRMDMIEFDPDTKSAAKFPWSHNSDINHGERYVLDACETCNALLMLSQAFLRLVEAQKCEHTLIHFLIHADALRVFAARSIPQ